MEWSKEILPGYILFKLNVERRDGTTTSRMREKYSSREKQTKSSSSLSYTQEQETRNKVNK